MENSREYPTPKVAMSIHAHPDDQEFTAAGTLAKWVKDSCYIISVIITSGDSGSNDPSKGGSFKGELAHLREAEQLAANAVLGIQETVFLHYPDGTLQPSLQLRRDLTRLIRRHKPEVVVCGDPTVRFFGNEYMNHPDHRVAADMACDAVFPSANTRLIFPELLTEGLEPHQVKRLYLSSPGNPDTWVDISETIDLKIEALRKHASQMGDWNPADEMRKWAEESGKTHGLTYAEAFHVMVLAEEKEDEHK